MAKSSAAFRRHIVIIIQTMKAGDRMSSPEGPKKNKARAASWKERFSYWFDNRIARGSLGLIRFLIVVSIVLAVVIAGLIILFGFHEDEPAAAVFWDSIATLLNAWMPYSGDGSLGYIILMAVCAIAGVLFTSVLIGIITSAIEEKIIEMRRGNSQVLESGHTVILGFYPGEYTLLRQLVLAAAGKDACVVVADDMEREEMEQSIEENVESPRNFRIVCRSADITDPAALERCALASCRTVIVHPTDDARTIKTLLAVSALKRDCPEADFRILSLLSGSEFNFPAALAEQYRITALREHDTLAKMIAHSCTQMGLSETFRELFNFDGSEWYVLPLPEMAGLSFGELTVRLDGAVPVGLYGPEGMCLNPPADRVIRPGEQLLAFSEDRDSIRLTDGGADAAHAAAAATEEADTSALILGCNDSLPVILRELPENVRRVLLAGRQGGEEEQARLIAVAAQRGLAVEFSNADLTEEGALEALAKNAEHVVILNDHEKEEEEADMEAIYLLLNLRDIRSRLGAGYNITTEMRRERNQNLAADNDRTDFVVASSMSSMVLAQLSESPELLGAFREILSNEGSEIYLRKAARLGLRGRVPVRSLRRAALEQGYVLLGYMDGARESCFNPPLDRELDVDGDLTLIVLGEK
jgi:voltage-gated potassium channel Kch